MKLNKLVITAAMMTAALSCASAQAALHGSIDFSHDAVAQEFTKKGSADLEKSKVAGGLDTDSSTKVDLKLNAANFEFNLGMKLNSSAGDEKYTDVTDNFDGTPFYQGNMKIGFLTDQINVYTGKFEDFDAGYIEPGYVLGTQNITRLASSSQGQHFTGVQVTPFSVAALRGLSVMCGLPILPVGGNGVNTDNKSNSWYLKNDDGTTYTLAQKVKVMASYEIPEIAKINVGFRPGTYYTGVKGEADTDFLTNYYSEGFLQASVPSLVEGLAFNVSYDIRYRKAAYTKIDGSEAEKTRLAHMAGISAEYALMDNLSIACEDRFYFADSDYIVADDKLLADVFAVSARFDLNDRWAFGGALAGMYAVDARGTAMAASSTYFDGFDFDDVSFASLLGDKGTTGKSTQYVGINVNPYAELKVNGGAVVMGANVYYGLARADKVNTMVINYAIPVGFKFAF